MYSSTYLLVPAAICVVLHSIRASAQQQCMGVLSGWEEDLCFDGELTDGCLAGLREVESDMSSRNAQHFNFQNSICRGPIPMENITAGTVSCEEGVNTYGYDCLVRHTDASEVCTYSLSGTQTGDTLIMRVPYCVSAQCRSERRIIGESLLDFWCNQTLGLQDCTLLASIQCRGRPGSASLSRPSLLLILTSVFLGAVSL